MTMAARAGIRHAPARPRSRPGPAPRSLITREGLRALCEEVARLQHELSVEYPKRLREALGFGEAHNNDDYLQIKEEEAVIASRIRQLEAVIANARVVDVLDHHAGQVAVGSTVEVEDVPSGRRSRHVITGVHESLAPTDISANSPIGRALLGREIGSVVDVELPSGRTVALRITEIR